MIQFPGQIKADLDEIQNVANDLKMHIYVVGGFPRDLVSGRGITNDTDLDITEHNGNTFDLAFFVAAKLGMPEPKIYERSGTAMMTMPSGRMVEFNNADFHVRHIIDQLFSIGVEPTPLNKDIYSRDFTMNTLLYDPVENSIIDITGNGVKDIRDKVLRTPIDPRKTLSSSPENILRGIRFALEMGLTIDSEFEKAISEFVPTLVAFLDANPDSQMVMKQVKKAFEADPERAYEMYERFGLIPHIPHGLPEMDQVVKDQMVVNSKMSWYRVAEPVLVEEVSPERKEAPPERYENTLQGKEAMLWIYAPDGDFVTERGVSHSLLLSAIVKKRGLENSDQVMSFIESLWRGRQGPDGQGGEVVSVSAPEAPSFAAPQEDVEARLRKEWPNAELKFFDYANVAMANMGDIMRMIRQASVGSDEEDEDEDVSRYFEIGHGDNVGQDETQFDEIWVFGPNGFETRAVVPKDENKAHNTHGNSWGHDYCDLGWKGRYDANENLVSVVSPSRLYDREPKVPYQIRANIESRWPRAGLEFFGCREASKKGRSLIAQTKPQKSKVPVPNNPDMFNHLLENREKHRAYMRRKRMEESREHEKKFQIFDALEHGNYEQLKGNPHKMKKQPDPVLNTYDYVK